MTLSRSTRDPYLTSRFDERQLAEMEEVRQRWGWTEEVFYTRVREWFTNFVDKNDRLLALKILEEIQYISEDSFKQRLAEYKKNIQQNLHGTGLTIRDVILAVPDVRGGSEDLHAYEVMKSWAMEMGKTLTVSEISDLAVTERNKKVLVLFNDTHGTGNQLLNSDLPEIPFNDFAKVFLIAITFAQEAIRNFDELLPEKITILDPVPAKSVRQRPFTYDEVLRIKELGKDVYPAHPLGYGDCGLLTVYWFQCPNNSLPIIWANGSNNAVKKSPALTWSALREYRPKIEPEKAPKPAPPPPVADPAIINRHCSWNLTREQMDKLLAQIDSWALTKDWFYERVGKWLNNFNGTDEGEKQFALDLFSRVKYLNHEQVQKCIDNLYEQLARSFRPGKGRSDIIIITTGHKKNSVYRYVGDFLQRWRLTEEQICDISELKPDKAYEKTLVLFYHTRPVGKFFFRPEVAGEPSHHERLSQLRPRDIFISAFAMAPGAAETFTKESRYRVLFDEELSEPVSKLPTELRQRLAQIEVELQPGEAPCDQANQLLVAYHFQCPTVTSPLIWKDQRGEPGRRDWSPLFPYDRSTTK